MKNDCLNVCKAIAAFFVVFIHCSFPSPVGGMMNGLARFAVPLFFMISGYFCFEKDEKVIHRRLRRTFFLFLAANGVYFLWKLAVFGWDGQPLAETFASLFQPKALAEWIFLNQSPMMGHLWFLGALLYCYLFYLFLMRFNWFGKQELFYLLIPLCLGLNLLLGEVLPVLGTEISFLAVRNFWLTGLPFFLWGHWFAKKQIKWEGSKSSFVCLAAIAGGAGLSMGEMLFTGGAELYAGSILMAAGIFYFAVNHPALGGGTWLAGVGERDSLHIYLWQLLLYDLTAAGAYTLGIGEHMVYQWLMPLWICLLSWLLAELIRHIKPFKIVSYSSK